MIDAIANTSNTMTQQRSPASIAVDNFLRKALRVGDPRDPDQIAGALLARYPDEAERDRRERAGLPYSTVPDSPVVTTDSGPSSVELTQARDDLERDLQTLATASELKDIRVEMVGWGRAIRQIASDGLAAARLALDSINHDRAMSARRSLYEYARLARYVGSISAGSTLHFRRLAQSCDVLAGLILVAIGEGLALSGITRSTALVRVAASELQARRNAVIVALRALTGSVEASLGQEDWPRGIEAFRNLVRRLENAGESDLRALLEETTIAQAMDELVDRSTGTNVEALRELQTTASLVIDRFQRLIQYGRAVAVPINQPISNGPPESPPLTAFMSALQLFVDAFQARGSSRLLHVARPAIIVYGLYGVAGADVGSDRLRAITILRSRVAEQIDCLCSCGCETDEVALQILGDYLVYLLDRSIDLYAVGTDVNGRGEAERRAVFTALVIGTVLANWPPPASLGLNPVNRLNVVPGQLGNDLQDFMNHLFRAVLPIPPPDYVTMMVRELRVAYQAEFQIERVVQSLAPSCDPLIFDVGLPDHDSMLRALLRFILANQFGVNAVTLPGPVQIPSPVASSIASSSQGRPAYWSTSP